MSALTSPKRQEIESRISKSSPRLWIKSAAFSGYAVTGELAFGSQMTYGMRITGPAESRQSSYFRCDLKNTNFFVGQPPR